MPWTISVKTVRNHVSTSSASWVADRAQAVLRARDAASVDNPPRRHHACAPRQTGRREIFHAALHCFLRAINVGGHTVKMDALRQLHGDGLWRGRDLHRQRQRSSDGNGRCGGTGGARREPEQALATTSRPLCAAMVRWRPLRAMPLCREGLRTVAPNVALFAAPPGPPGDEGGLSARTAIDDFQLMAVRSTGSARRNRASRPSNAVFERALANVQLSAE